MKRKLFIVGSFIAIAVLVLAIHSPKGSYAVVEVFDGDTIAVNMDGVTEKIRLIGMDTPETKDPRKPVQCYGQEASEFTHKTLANVRVTLVADPLSTNRDRYNRLLRYVYLKDGTLYNQLLLQKGFARAYTGFPFSKYNDFVQTQSTAKSTNKGLWANCPNEAA